MGRNLSYHTITYHSTAYKTHYLKMPVKKLLFGVLTIYNFDIALFSALDNKPNTQRVPFITLIVLLHDFPYRQCKVTSDF